MRPADNGFAHFSIDYEKGTIADATKEQTQTEGKTIGESKFIFFKDKFEDTFAYLNISDEAYLNVHYNKDIDPAQAEKVISSIKLK